MTIEENFSRDGFEKWLNSQPEKGEVGRASTGCDCPVARYINSLGPIGKVRAVVHRYNFAYYEPTTGAEVCREAPGWMSDFVGNIDRAWESSVVLAHEAIRVLSHSKPQTFNFL